MGAELIPHPEVERCRHEVTALQRELARLLAEGEELAHVQGPALLLRYQLELGPAELAALEAEVAYRRQLRAVELARAALARGLKPAPLAIEAALDAELRAWSNGVFEAARKLQHAREWDASPALSKEDHAALKSLHWALVRRLHPDLNGSLTADERRLWHRVQEAYVACDLEALRDLSTIAGAGAAGLAESNVWEELDRERTRLRKRLDQLLAELARLRAAPPLDLAPLLADPVWVEARRRDATERAKGFEERRQQLLLEWIALVETRHDSTVGPN